MNTETEKIYNIAFDLIELRLNKKEIIHPFTVVKLVGIEKPEIAMYDTGETDTLSQLETIRSNLRTQASEGKITAICLCYSVAVTDPRTKEKTDAIQIEVSDRGSDPVNIYIPYNFSDEVIIKKPFQTVSDQNYF